MQDFQALWTTTASGETGSSSGSAPGGQSGGADHRERGLSTSTSTSGQGPINARIEASPFTRDEIELMLNTAHVLAFLALAYVTLTEN